MSFTKEAQKRRAGEEVADQQPSLSDVIAAVDELADIVDDEVGEVNEQHQAVLRDINKLKSQQKSQRRKSEYRGYLLALTWLAILGIILYLTHFA